MLIFTAVIAAVCVVVLMLSLCAAASGADRALERMADRALGPASSDAPAPILLNTSKQDGGIELGVLLAFDPACVPHERRHGAHL